jgi:hypothetical protein
VVTSLPKTFTKAARAAEQVNYGLEGHSHHLKSTRHNCYRSLGNVSTN